jgi:transposase
MRHLLPLKLVSRAGKQEVMSGKKIVELAREEVNVTGTEAQPDPEVSDKPKRRRFSAEYKLRVLKEADGCTKPGELGALLRREGLYSSNLTAWRQARGRGELAALKPKKRGRKKKVKDARDKRIAELERETRRLRRKLGQAETVIDVQKKVASMLGIPLQNTDDDEGSA